MWYVPLLLKAFYLFKLSHVLQLLFVIISIEDILQKSDTKLRCIYSSKERAGNHDATSGFCQRVAKITYLESCIQVPETIKDTTFYLSKDYKWWTSQKIYEDTNRIKNIAIDRYLTLKIEKIKWTFIDKKPNQKEKQSRKKIFSFTSRLQTLQKAEQFVAEQGILYTLLNYFYVPFDS